MMKLPFLFAIVALVSGQSGFDFTFSRPNPNDRNFLELRCEDRNGPVSGPMFFRGDEMVTVQPSGTDTYFFAITQLLEGEYTCGTRDDSGMSTSLSKTIVGRHS